MNPLQTFENTQMHFSSTPDMNIPFEVSLFSLFSPCEVELESRHKNLVNRRPGKGMYRVKGAMFYKNSHPSDQELLLFADGELSERRASHVSEHVAACRKCRVRMAEFEHTISAFMEAQQRCFDTHLPPVAGARARLKSQIAKEQPVKENWWTFRLPLISPRLVYSCALALLIFLAITATYHWAISRQPQTHVDALLLPDRNLTPGATKPVSINDICSMEHDQVVRPVSAALQRRVFREYGLRDARVANYEVDYLISPGLGGTDDIRNLWPEPRYNTTWNSFVKDQLEDYLHQSVCAGKLDLATAQKDLSTDWITAYKKYFSTNKPLDLSSSTSLALLPFKWCKAGENHCEKS